VKELIGTTDTSTEFILSEVEGLALISPVRPEPFDSAQDRPGEGFSNQSQNVSTSSTRTEEMNQKVLDSLTAPAHVEASFSISASMDVQLIGISVQLKPSTDNAEQITTNPRID